MTVWAMLLGMATLVNITMIGAMISLAGNVPDSSFLAILSRYLAGKHGPTGTVLYPLEAASRLERLRHRVLAVAAAAAAAALVLTAWALAAGWGPVAMSAVTLWLLAANTALIALPLGLWRRRAGRIREQDVEEAWRKSRPAEQEEADRPGGEVSRGST